MDRKILKIMENVPKLKTNFWISFSNFSEFLDTAKIFLSNFHSFFRLNSENKMEKIFWKKVETLRKILHKLKPAWTCYFWIFKIVFDF